MDFNNSAGGIVGRIGAQFKDTSDKDTDLYFATRADSGSLTEKLRIKSDGDIDIYGTASGVSSVTWDASANSLIFKDESKSVYGDDSDLSIYRSATAGWVHHGGSGYLFIQGNDIALRSVGQENYITCDSDNYVKLWFDNSEKLATTNDGVNVTGIATVTQGMHFQGMLREDCNIVANKLSAATNIDLENGMVHYFSTNETTTATPNIRWNSSYSLNNKMSTGEAVTVTIIYKPNGAGYYANMTIDSGSRTEEWNGGAAPSAANAGGYDVLTHTIIKTGNGAYIVLSNVQNYA
jgi:hypothetical protein